MIIGIILGIALAVFLTSLGIIILGISGTLTENLITGAAIGVNNAVAYSSLTLIISLTLILLIVLILANKRIRDNIPSPSPRF